MTEELAIIDKQGDLLVDKGTGRFYGQLCIYKPSGHFCGLSCPFLNLKIDEESGKSTVVICCRKEEMWYTIKDIECMVSNINLTTHNTIIGRSDISSKPKEEKVSRPINTSDHYR